MKRLQPIRLAATLALLPALLPSDAGAEPLAGDIEVFLDSPGPGGALLALSEEAGTAAPRAAKLTGLAFLPVDFQGRTQVSALLPGTPRYLDDVPGASRIELPGSGGFLYRHARVDTDGTTRFGFLHVTPEGLALPIAEISGAGALGTDDPYFARVAIARDGLRLLAATRPAAGGDVFELDLALRTVINRSPNVPPLPWRDGGLALADDFGIAISTRGIFRFGAQPGSVVQRVPLSSNPDWYSGEIALSSNGRYAITTAGQSEALAHAFVFSDAGPAERVTETPAHLSGGGYLPGALDGPFLAVADDGSTAAWRVEGLTREAFLGKVQAPPGQDPVQVTSNAYFTDTLDEVGVLIAAQIGAFIVAVGELSTDPGEALENADFFRVTLDANGAPQFENITLTSGDAAPPFLNTPELTPMVVRYLPEAAGFLVWDEQSGGTGRLIKVLPSQPGLHVLMNDVKSTDFVAGVADELLLSVRRDFGQDPRQILRLPRDLSTAPSVLVDGGADVDYLYPVTRDDGWIAFLARFEAGGERVQRVRLAAPVLETFPLGTGNYGEVLGLSPSGALLVSLSTGTARFFTWPFESSPPLEHAAPPLAEHFVPGR